MVNYYNEPKQESNLNNILGALSNDKRRGMVSDLALRPATVKQLANYYGLSLPAIHKHIRILEDAGLIERRKVGRTNFIALNRRGLQELQAYAMQFNTSWGNGQESLENYIAGMQ